MKKLITFENIVKVIVAIILLQTLFFKFTAAPESVFIFEKLGMEPTGRIGSGIVELIASILLFVPGLTWLAAILALGTMTGAIFSHLTILGISVLDDGGLLFFLALTVFIGSLFLLWKNRKQIPLIGKKLATRN